MRYWSDWHQVKDPCTQGDWDWVNSIMGPRGPDRWMHVEQFYYFKHARDATLFRLRWCR